MKSPGKRIRTVKLFSTELYTSLYLVLIMLWQMKESRWLTQPQRLPYCEGCRHQKHISFAKTSIVNPPPILILEPVYPSSSNPNDIYGKKTSFGESYPFRVSEYITLGDVKYIHMMSIMAWPNHFWSVANIDSNIYFGEIKTNQKYLLHRGAAPYITQWKEENHPVQPMYHIYRVCVDLTPTKGKWIVRTAIHHWSISYKDRSTLIKSD